MSSPLAAAETLLREVAGPTVENTWTCHECGATAEVSYVSDSKPKGDERFLKR